MAAADTIVSLPDQATAALPKRSFLTECVSRPRP